MKHKSHDLLDERGAAGKFFLVLFGVVLIIVAAGYFLWKPVLEPLVGEAMAKRLDTQTSLYVPREEPAISLVVPEGWVVQRGFFKPETALITSPDLSMQIEIRTWLSGDEPSFAGAIQEVASELTLVTDPQTEAVSDATLLHYVIANELKEEVLVAVIGKNKNLDVSARSSALLIVRVHEGDISEYFATLAELTREIQVLR